MKSRSLICVYLFFLLINFTVTAKGIDDAEIPPQLKPWKAWVLKGAEMNFCPSPFNNGNEYLCQWPSRLELKLGDNGGTFSQEFIVYAEDWITLPGNNNAWPYDLMVDGSPVPVVNRKGLPSVLLKKGAHTIQGAFKWKNMSEMINVPEKTALVDLLINSKPVESPLLDNEGRLWLQNKKVSEAEEDRLEVKVFRMVDDDIPMYITNLVRLYISGQAREVKLADTLPAGFIPMEIESPLPVMIQENGDVIIQARPGKWDIYIKERSKGPVNSIGPINAAFGQEIWSVQSQNHLRMINIKGVQGIDPGQTDLPGEWRQYPAYIINKGDTLVLEQTKRGDPSPAPDHLTMMRTIWLDFNGDGYTIKDTITGTMSTQWYLAMNQPLKLGRVVLDGVDQLITSHGKDKKPGIELRKGHINLEGESRVETGKNVIPAVGWDHNVQGLSATLNLPPGWRLINVGGVDSIEGTWLQNWGNLLDIFLVLVISTALYRLYNIRYGIIALITLVLIYHEPDAPRTVFISILAATALLRFIPAGWFRKIIELWRIASIVVLFIMVVSFIADQARTGIYPQLENTRSYLVPMFMKQAKPAAPPVMQEEAMMSRRPAMRDFAERDEEEFTLNEIVVTSKKREALSHYMQKNVMLQDPKALIQTGPGLPQWQWHSYDMRWNGPVDSSQNISIWLISPFINLILSFVRIILIVILTLIIIEIKNIKVGGMKAGATVLLLIFMLIPLSENSFAQERGDFPPQAMLNELRNRLLEKDDCFPYCADSPQMDIITDKDNLRIIFRVHASTETAVPLPGSSMMWNPEEISIGNSPAENLFRDNSGIMWVLVPKGVHDVVMRGKVPQSNEFQVPLTLIPHTVSLKLDGWASYGVDKDGQVQGSIKFVRLEKKSMEGSTDSSPVLPPFFNIERIISLGIDWQLHTVVRRVTPANDPVVVSIPLVNGESVITGGVKVENNRIVVSMSPDETEKLWSSTITPSNEISLKASETIEWTETWILDASPIWHCELSGIPLIHHQDASGQWRPEWRPWQGEEIKINITRPAAVQGKIVTIDNARLTHSPGKRISTSSLDLNIRSSQGGQHKIMIPEGAELRQVMISGKSQPINQEGRNVTVPLNPGVQQVNLEWQAETGSRVLVSSPKVDLTTEAVNAYVTFNMPQNRWILFAGGPVLGPAVLFWGYLVVIIIIGVLLGRIKFTPLGTASWILLGIGLTQVPVSVAIMVAGWFIAMGLRKQAVQKQGEWVFNIAQVILAIWFIAAMAGIWTSIQSGLLGIPDMQIQGNGSTDYMLNWMQDRVASELPNPWVISLHIFFFKALMLLWALWLVYSLILKWLPWAWGCFSEGGIFKKMVFGKRKKSENVQPPPLKERGGGV
ncbi:MAG: hypothetical protein JW927_21480 [Deltaproteobacteria bacterium]|nr:hypothetical protein [Deltaproteobacteria bacterium]